MRRVPFRGRSLQKGHSGAFRGVAILEAAAAILFFGILAGQPELERCGTNALHELAAHGYEIPTRSDPVRVYAARTEGSFSSSHAGGWRPGVISLRPNPRGDIHADAYLRHELMHEASFRTCSEKLPLWAEEAAAMAFSGELAVQSVAGPPSEIELDHLKKQARIGTGLDPGSNMSLARLVAVHGWPRQPCTVSAEIERLLR